MYETIADEAPVGMDRGISYVYHQPPSGEGDLVGAGITERERRWAAVYPHRERLLRIARARLGNAYDAEDCVQEAMLRCVEFVHLDEERIGQFLTTVTIRLCTDVHRGQARGDRLSRRLTSYSTVEPGPEDAVCDRAESVWLSRHVEDLPPKQRAILEARAEGLSCSAVAERLLVSYSAVESAMARVRRSMRLALESTLGIAAWPRSWRSARRMAGATLLAGVTTVTTLHLVTVGPAGPAVPERALDLTTGRSSAESTVAVAAVRASLPNAARPSVPPATPAARASAPSPSKAREYAHLDLADKSASVTKHQHDYSLIEHVGYCVRYGVTVVPGIECQTPPDDPSTPSTPVPGGQS